MSVPDYPLGQTIDFKFTTRAFATGIPTTLAGTPVIQIYEDNGLTQITAGITLTVDFDGVTGLNNVRIVATSGNGFGANQSYAAVISTGTVGGVSVVGEVVQQFTIERSPVNWARVTAPTTAVDLSGTDIQLVDTVTTYTGNTPQTGDSFARIGVAGAGLTNIDLPNQTMDITGNLSGSVGSVTGAVGSVTGAVGSVTGNVGGNVVGSVGSNLELGPTEVNAEMVDVLVTDTVGTMAQGAPPELASFRTMVNYLYRALRNRSVVDTNTANQIQYFADDQTTILWEKNITNVSNVTTVEEGQSGA